MTAARHDEDPQTLFHPSIGCPGETVIYIPHNLHTLRHASSSTSASISLEEDAPRIEVTVPPASIHNIFAHRQWRAGMLLADLIYSTSQVATWDESHLLLNLRDKRVLELGAGTGLPGIMAAQEQASSTRTDAQARMMRAQQVVLSDYDEAELITRLKVNVKTNTLHCMTKTSGVGHIWGQDVSDLLDILLPTPHSPPSDLPLKFDVVLLADCLWDRLSHAALLKTLGATLARSKNARVYVASGLHTGRETLVEFVGRARRVGFCVRPWLECEEEGGFRVVDADEEGEEEWTKHFLEVRLTSIDAEPEPAEKDAGDSNTLIARGPRMTTHTRPFVMEERPEERKEVGGVQERNKWMTFWSLGWKDEVVSPVRVAERSFIPAA